MQDRYPMSRLSILPVLCASAIALVQAPGPQLAVPVPSVLLDPGNNLLLVVLDHQTGLLQTIRDIAIAELRANSAVLAKVAELAKLPILTTASQPSGPGVPSGLLTLDLATAAPPAK